MIFRALREKGKRTRRHMNPVSQLYYNQRLQELAIAKQLSLVAITDCLSWLPIIALGLMAQSGVFLGHAAYRWSAMVVLPMNSALNPVLYTAPEIRKRWKEFNRARRKPKVDLILRARVARRKAITMAVSRRRRVLRCRRALIRIRRNLLARSKREQAPRRLLMLLFLKIEALKERRTLNLRIRKSLSTILEIDIGAESP